MTLDSKITIVIPTFNSAEYLGSTLASLCHQSSRPCILIADGGSRDATLKIVNSYTKHLPITVCSFSDTGQANGLNKALSFVTSSHTLWLNSDDILLPGAVDTFEQCIHGIDQNIPYISADTFLFDPTYRIRIQKGCKQHKHYARNGIWIGSFPCILWNTEILRQVNFLDENYNYAMDYDLVIKLSLSSRIFTPYLNHHIPRVLGGFRLHHNSKTSGSHFQSAQAKENAVKSNSEIKSILSRYNISKSRYLFYFFCLRTLNPRILIHSTDASQMQSIKNTLQMLDSYNAF